MTDSPRDQLGTVPPADDLTRAREELEGLAEHWEERQAAYDPAAAGNVYGEEGSPWRDAARRFMANRIAVIATFVLIGMAFMSIFGPYMTDAESTLINYRDANLGMSAEHPFGTDPQGRDLWQRAWAGGRISLAIAFATAVTILVIGMLYGAISGYVGGRTDSVMMRFLDSLYGLPYLPFAIMFVTVMRSKFPDLPPIGYMVPALAITTWFTAARIMRSQVLTLKENDYVDAARSSGASGGRVLGRHIAPNTLGIMVVAIFLEVPNAILGEAFLSYLGLGVQLPNTSWGRLAHEGAKYFTTYPHLVWVPSLLIAITTLAAVAMADGMRDALDPRGKRN